MTYARARVFSGMVSTGWWVAICILALLTDISGKIALFEGETHYGAILGVFVLGYTILGLPLDVWGGYILPKKFSRRQETFIQWFGKWCRGVLAHGSLMWLTGVVLVLVAGEVGTIAAIAFVGLMMMLQSRFQLSLGQLISPMKLKYEQCIGNGGVPSFEHMRFAVVDSEDEDFTGGVFGRPGKEVIVLPAKWKDKLQPELLETITVRRLGAVLTGSRNRGLLIAIIWNLIGFSLAAYFTPHPLSSAAGAIDVALIFSLFSFVGLFGVLPFFSRKGILEVDSWAQKNGLSQPRLQRIFSFYSKQAGDSPTRPQMIEFFCHPIPSVENRLQSMLLEETPTGAWHVARQSLFLSWAGLGLLSRFAHCNLGRPELWAMLPCE